MPVDGRQLNLQHPYPGIATLQLQQGTGWPPTWKTWKSQEIWKWSGKSQGKCVLACGVLPPV